MNRCSFCFIACLLFAVAFGSIHTCHAQQDSHWTQLRGQDGSGKSPTSTKPPVKIDFDQQVLWDTEIPGTGWSSPVYNDELIWMTTAVSVEASKEEIEKKLKGDPLAKIKTLAKSVELRAIAVSKSDGKLIHNVLLTNVDSPEPINPMNSYASPTPALADGKVICHFGSYGTWCLDTKTAKSVWDTKYVVSHSVGPGSSPVVFDDKVILVCDGTDKQYVAAVDLKTGKEIWKTSRPPIRATNGEYQKAYSTPIQITVNDQKQLVIPCAQWVAGYEPETGKEIWRVDHGSGFSVSPMPIFDSGLVIFSTGYMRPEYVAVDPSGTGDVTKSHIKWRYKGASTMPSTVVNDGKLYAVTDKGIMLCLDVKTGKELNKVRVGGGYSASPLLAGGLLYVANRDGVMKVIRCSEALETLATNRFESSIMASPIVVDEDLLIRTEKKLMRIRK
ncbi:MAG: PQQ-binding-like beta-propeller repeat protein [Planctomycetota bacterium]